MFRKATETDIDAISKIYEAILDKEETGTAYVGWQRGVYPTRQTAADAVARGDMYVETADGAVAAAGIINHAQVKEYADCTWSVNAPDNEIMVLHTLVVNPEIKGRGFGSAFVKFYESTAREAACKALRIDTQVKNTPARAFYKKQGFTEVGTVTCTFNGISGVQLVCIEKVL